MAYLTLPYREISIAHSLIPASHHMSIVGKISTAVPARIRYPTLLAARDLGSRQAGAPHTPSLHFLSFPFLPPLSPSEDGGLSEVPHHHPAPPSICPALISPIYCKESMCSRHLLQKQKQNRDFKFFDFNLEYGQNYQQAISTIL